MGRLEKPALGKLSGRVGNIVGRDFGYDHFISVRPEKYKVKKKLIEVSSKQRFYTAVKLAKTIVTFPDLKEVWDKSNMPGKRGYNRIITANYKFLRNNLPTTENIITPKGRALLFDMLEVSDKKIRCSYDMAGLIKPPFCLTFIILFYNPNKTEHGLNYILVDRTFIEPEYADRAMDKKGEKYLGDYCFGDLIKLNRKRFRNAILYAAVVGTPIVKNKKWWTSTVAIDISNFKLRFLFLPRNKQALHDKRRQMISKLQDTYSKKYKRQQA
jgi:hypothetical protein